MDEQLKQRVMAGVVGFNFTVILLTIVQYAIFGANFMWGETMSKPWTGFLGQLFLSALVGLAVGAGAFFAAGMSQK